MLKSLLYLSSFIIFLQGYTQTFSTENGIVHFIAKTDRENIDAQNKKTSVVVSFDTKTINANLLIKDFNFKNEKEKDDFLHKTMQINTFSQATFSGNFRKITETNYHIIGVIEVHGITTKLNFPAKLNLTDTNCEGKATFIIQYTDFEITPPKKRAKSLSKEILVSLKFNLNKTKDAITRQPTLTRDTSLQSLDVIHPDTSTTLIDTTIVYNSVSILKDTNTVHRDSLQNNTIETLPESTPTIEDTSKPTPIQEDNIAPDNKEIIKPKEAE